MTSENSLTIPLSEALPGTRLAAAVLGADGQVLMTAGSVLTDSSLQGLNRRGIASVEVVAQRDESELIAARDIQRQRLARLFRRCETEGESSGALLYQAVLAYRLETLQ